MGGVDPLVVIMEEDRLEVVMDLEDQVAVEEDVEDLLEVTVMVSELTVIERKIEKFIKKLKNYIADM